MKAGEKVPLKYRKDLSIEAFRTRHTQVGRQNFLPSMGVTLYNHKNKLKDEYLGYDTTQIIELRKQGIEITREVFDPLITFMGDCLGDNLTDPDLAAIWNSEVLVTECTFVDDGEESMADKKGHTHIAQLVKALEIYGPTMQCKHIVLNHFSMKYSSDHILGTILKKIPEAYRDKIIAFI